MKIWPPSIPLPSDWPALTKTAVLHAITLAHFGLTHIRGWCENSRIERVKLKGENERLRSELALAQEELRIKDARLGRIPPAKRPHYRPTERLRILELRAARAWNHAQTARAFLVTEATIATWLKRLGEQGPEALLQIPAPVNRFPDFVAHLVQQLRLMLPAMGKVRVVQLLARAGLHLSASTVKRMSSRRLRPRPPSAEDCADGDAACPQGRLRRPDPPAASVRDGAASATANRAGADDTNNPPSAGAPYGANGPDATTDEGVTPASVTQAEPGTAKRRVRADYSDHVWNVDLTVVPTCGGFWTSWLAFSLPQCWPFAWWIVAVVDHYSRQIMALDAYFSQPSESEVRALLDRAVASAGRAPRYTVTDQGGQFGDGYRQWCRSHDVRPRFVAIGQSGSIALIERFMLTLKEECTRRLLVPLRLADLRAELSLFATWYGSHRPHQSLGGRTPSEVYEAGRVVPFFAAGAQHATAANDSTPDALDVQVVPARGATSPAARASPADLPKLELEVTFLEGRRHLPIVKLRRAA